jgi:peptidoglycan/xylan/chitin deacetylase (PgdA/CDA1 family)
MYISLTFDIDWAPDFVLSELIKFLEQENLKSTFFVTHESCILRENSNNPLIEIALHPSFNHSLNNKSNIDFFSHFIELKSIYNNAVGFRSHCLFQSSQILIKAKELAMVYDSNLLLFNQVNLMPFVHPSLDMLRIPYVFSDDTFLFNNNNDMNILSLFENNQSPYLVFGFHPIHVYLNSENIERYAIVKNDLQNEILLKKNINNQKRGIRDLLDELINYGKEKNIKFLQMKEIYEMETLKIKK